MGELPHRLNDLELGPDGRLARFELRVEDIQEARADYAPHYWSPIRVTRRGGRCRPVGARDRGAAAQTSRSFNDRPLASPRAMYAALS